MREVCTRKAPIDPSDQRTQLSGTLIRFGLAASASCGNPPTRYRVFSASVVCLAIAKLAVWMDIHPLAGGWRRTVELSCRWLVVSRPSNGMLIAARRSLS